MMIRRLYLGIIILILIIMTINGCSQEAKSSNSAVDAAKVTETELYIFAAASLSNAMTEIQDMYKEVNPKVHLTMNLDSSGTLQTQIEEGAECDIFFSAAMKQMSELMEGGYIKEDSIVNLLENTVVLIKPAGIQTAVTGFENIDEAKNIALAAMDVPVGAYAREIFTNLGILDKVEQMEINEGSNVSAVLAAVSEASNEVGVVYATDAYSVKDSVEIIAEAPADSLDTRVIYPAGLVYNIEADDMQQKAAEDFLEYLSSKEVLAVFEKYGFRVHQD